jgi:hypothetical protein
VAKKGVQKKVLVNVPMEPRRTVEPVHETQNA